MILDMSELMHQKGDEERDVKAKSACTMELDCDVSMENKRDKQCASIAGCKSRPIKPLLSGELLSAFPFDFL